MFHVEHGLLSDAECPEQGIEHILRPGPPRQFVDRTTHMPEGLRHDQHIALSPRLGKQIRYDIEHRALPGVQGIAIALR